MAAMQSASLSRPEEVTMLTRRIVACACALALAVPAAAAARPGFDAPVQKQDPVAYGDTKYDLQNTQDLAPKGDTKNDIKPSYADRVGSLSPAQLAAAYGTTQPKGTPIASAPAVTTHRVIVPAGKGVGGRIVPLHHNPSAGSSDNDVNGWQIAAVAEAGLLAALLLGSAALVGRTRPSGTARA
jgi:hypothetical protein